MLHVILFIGFAMGFPHAAAQPGDLWPPLVSQDGHIVTHVPGLM